MENDLIWCEQAEQSKLSGKQTIDVFGVASVNSLKSQKFSHKQKSFYDWQLFAKIYFCKGFEKNTEKINYPHFCKEITVLHVIWMQKATLCTKKQIKNRIGWKSMSQVGKWIFFGKIIKNQLYIYI